MASADGRIYVLRAGTRHVEPIPSSIRYLFVPTLTDIHPPL